MIGIKAYGAYIPFYRIRKSEIAAAYGKAGKGGEKAVAYYDEDSLTLAVGAAMNALPGADGSGLSGVSFASTTAPYAEKQCAPQIAAVLDCPRSVRTADFSHSLKCFSDAVLSALAFAKNGETTLVAAADCRLGGNDGAYENDLGDGAAAFVIGEGDGVIAEFLDTFSVSVEAYDMWRSSKERTVRFWDVRFADTQIFQPCVREAVAGILGKTGLAPADFSKVVCYAHEERHSRAILTKLGFAPEQIQPGYYSEIGNTGCAAAPLMLAAALDTAAPGDRILFLSYGDGCNAAVLQVTEKIRSRRGRTVRELIDCKDSTLPYGKYLKWKEFLQCEPQRRPPAERSSVPDYFRGYKKNHAMYGSRCTVCGTPQFPPQRVCAICRSVDKAEPYRFIGRKAHLRTFTLDGLALSQDPPNNLVVAEFEGGGKIMTYLVECPADEIRVKLPVTLSFRRMYEANGMNTYFWKVVPCRETEDK